MKRTFITLVFLVLLSGPFMAGAVTYYTRVSGNWNALTTWSTVACGGAAAAVLPSATDDIIVCVGTSVTVNVNATIANVTISNGGTLQNGGGSTTNRSLTVTGILNVSAGGTLIQNSILNASTTLFAGTEVFSPTATLTVSNWSSRAVTLITGLNSNLGHVNLNWSSGVLWWDNQGLGVVKTIQGNLTIGTSCQTFLDSTGAALAISIPGNLTVNGKLRVKNGTSGNAALLVNGNASLGASGIFTGIYAGAGDFTFSVNNLVSVAGSTFNGLLDGHGNTGVSINGTFTCAGNFYGINAPAVMNNGVPDIQINSLTYNGGTFMASCTHNLGGLATVNIISHATVNFTIAADKIQLLGLSSLGGSNVTTRLNFTVGGNLTVGGLSTCELKTSEAYGEETVSVNGVFTSTAAKTLFNGGLTDASGHKVKVSLGGYVISGGTVWFSENPSDTVLITVNGNVQISGGVSILKSSTGYARMTVNGNFTQNLVGSLLYMHGPDQLGLASAANDFADIRVNGNFTQSGGILYFDNYDSPAEQRIYINGPSYTISNSATMERAGYGTSSSFARIIFEYPGTV
ncbi:MAG: hypothetical protein JNL88_07720, partial [Bacteroidia bacterium]|nr:hypothetical protein [Bacteroidia bacterium]